jgi:hypothetical protein
MDEARTHSSSLFRTVEPAKPARPPLGIASDASADPRNDNPKGADMSTIREQMEATHRGVVAGDQARLHGAIHGVDWEERGLLGRLSRVFRPEEPHRLDTAVEDRVQDDIAA